MHPGVTEESNREPALGIRWIGCVVQGEATGGRHPLGPYPSGVELSCQMGERCGQV